MFLESIRVEVSDNLGLNAEEKKILDQCVTKYPRKWSFNQCAYLTWNSIKHIFGRSDWQVAQKMLKNKLKGKLWAEKSEKLTLLENSVSQFFLKYFVTINVLGSSTDVPPGRAKLEGAIPMSFWMNHHVGKLSFEDVAEKFDLIRAAIKA